MSGPASLLLSPWAPLELTWVDSGPIEVDLDPVGVDLGLWYVRMCSSGGVIGYPESFTIHVLGRQSMHEEYPEHDFHVLQHSEDR